MSFYLPPDVRSLMSHAVIPPEGRVETVPLKIMSPIVPEYLAEVEEELCSHRQERKKLCERIRTAQTCTRRELRKKDWTEGRTAHDLIADLASRLMSAATDVMALERIREGLLGGYIFPAQTWNFPHSLVLEEVTTNNQGHVAYEPVHFATVASISTLARDILKERLYSYKGKLVVTEGLVLPRDKPDYFVLKDQKTGSEVPAKVLHASERKEGSVITEPFSWHDRSERFLPQDIIKSATPHFFAGRLDTDIFLIDMVYLGGVFPRVTVVLQR